MDSYIGTVIEESLSDKTTLKKMYISRTRIEPTTERHRTPWVKQWTMHSVVIPGTLGAEVAEELSRTLDPDHAWYADFRRDSDHYIIFRNRVFHITDRSDTSQYDAATTYGLHTGIPDYQLDFSRHVKMWKR